MGRGNNPLLRFRLLGKRHCHNLSKVLLPKVTTLSDCHKTNNYSSSNEKGYN
jgi:hypothetical protein